MHEQEGWADKTSGQGNGPWRIVLSNGGRPRSGSPTKESERRSSGSGRRTARCAGSPGRLHWTTRGSGALVGMDHTDPKVVALFGNQMRIETLPPYTAFGLPGDSGSLVVKKRGSRAVGLYFAGPPGGE